MALRLKLKAGERAIVGGAVIRNGSHRAELVVENDTPVLRESDVLRPDAVRTPCERIYLTLQLMYVDDSAPELYADAYRTLTDEVLTAAPSLAARVRAIDEQVRRGRLFQALRQARILIEHERELLSHAS
ncbi:MAG: hypothetical protein RL005_507 [Planctomycetota bacterium]|jgi:flagellar protein FlbT